MFIYLKFCSWRRGWPVGLVAWFSLRVREVPGSTPGQAPFSRPYFSLFFFCFICLFMCFCFFFSLSVECVSWFWVGRSHWKKKLKKKITKRTTLKIHNILLKHVPVFLYSVTMLIFQIKRIISGEKWVNRVVTFFFILLFFYFFIDDVKAILLIISV